MLDEYVPVSEAFPVLGRISPGVPPTHLGDHRGHARRRGGCGPGLRPRPQDVHSLTLPVADAVGRRGAPERADCISLRFVLDDNSEDVPPMEPCIDGGGLGLATELISCPGSRARGQVRLTRVPSAVHLWNSLDFLV